MLIKKPADIKPSEITPYDLYRQRRRFIQGAGALAATSLLTSACGDIQAEQSGAEQSGAEQASSAGQWQGRKLLGAIKSPYSTDEALTSYDSITIYNNFYEYGTGKGDPAGYAPKYLKPEPWSVKVSGECDKPGSYAYEDFIKGVDLEERIYRLRCVEAWSMVIPWLGFPMGEVLAKFKPTSKAKYVEFKTLFDPEQMPGQRRAILDWPYVEGLRMDEAMHPLTIFAVGLYDEVMPAQNGAPLRLVVPWKYGFKSIKSIVEVTFTERQPVNTWQAMSPSEYGFYANVNPELSHPRWSQARERRVGELFRRKTLPFNGYGEQVASLYRGMDPKTLF